MKKLAQFFREVAKLILAMAAALAIMTATTWNTNAQRVEEYNRLEAKLDAVVEYSGLMWADKEATDVINAEHEYE